MEILLYTIEQAELINHIKQKVDDLFKQTPVPAHGIEHVREVVSWAEKIASEEDPGNAALSVIEAWLHDIGRTQEHYTGEQTRAHHELSYILAKQWFKTDPAFDILSNYEKREILYAVRYHWNDEACDYKSAIILRDADKLDAFGEHGLERALESFPDDPKGVDLWLRLCYQLRARLRTQTAKRFMEDQDLFAPIEYYYNKTLIDAIRPIELE